MNKGYIAITSALIISILLMAVVFSVSSSGYFARSNTVGAFLKAEGRALADACVSRALLRLSENRKYSGNEAVAINDENCTILPVESISGNYVIKTMSNLRGIVTNLKVETRGSDLAIISWGEVASF